MLLTDSLPAVSVTQVALAISALVIGFNNAHLRLRSSKLTLL